MKKIKNFFVSKLKFIMIIVGVVILYLLLRSIGFDTFVDIVSSMDKGIILLALIPWIITLCLGTYRLKTLVRTDIPFFEMLRIYLYGYLLNYASAIQGLGAGAKVTFLKMKKISIARSSASVGLEIAYDALFSLLVTVLFLLFNLSFFLEKIKPLINTSLFIIGFLVLVVIALILFIMRKNTHVIEFVTHFFSSFTPKRVMTFLPLTMLQWVFPGTMMYLFFVATGHEINIFLAISALCVGFIFSLISFIPGGLGVRDAIIAYVYSISGIPLDVTISISLFNRFFTIGTVFLFVVLIKLYDFLKKEKKR